MIPMSALGHHGEPADPTLLEWIGHRIDELVGIGPVALAAILGLTIVAIPTALVVWYLLATRKRA
jgi:hypothetical protein